MAWKPPKKKVLRLLPRYGPEFVTRFKQHNAAGPMDTKRRRDRAVATGRSRKPRHAKDIAEENPWKESDLPRTAPCRKCGGEGVLPSFSHVHKGECFRCRGSGHAEKDWRCTAPELFSVLGSPVRVYTVKGDLKALVRQKDFNERGTPMLDLGSPMVATFFARPGGRVDGAFHAMAGWQVSALVQPPMSSLLEAFPSYFETMYPEPPLSDRPPRERALLEERRALISRAESKLARRLIEALREHYRRT